MTHEEISQRLVQMFDDDQKALGPNGERGQYQKLRVRHVQELKEIIKEIGWPTIDLVGSRASQAAWLIAQHADHDRDFQRTALELMKKLPGSAVKKSNIAYLTDRVQVNQGQRQTYGTQFTHNDQGELIPFPIDDKETVNERRKLVGLETIEEYLRTSQEIHKDIATAKQKASAD